jgi:hypothetical protein
MWGSLFHFGQHAIDELARGALIGSTAVDQREDLFVDVSLLGSETLQLDRGSNASDRLLHTLLQGCVLPVELLAIVLSKNGATTRLLETVKGRFKIDDQLAASPHRHGALPQHLQVAVNLGG